MHHVTTTENQRVSSISRHPLSVIMISVALCILPVSALAERDKLTKFRHFDSHHQQAERKHQYQDHYRRGQYDRQQQQQKRIARYRNFQGNNYSSWRNRRAYPARYYGHDHDRHRAHYLRYHNSHSVVHHYHDDNYLEWVTAMLLINELLDDDYR